METKKYLIISWFVVILAFAIAFSPLIYNLILPAGEDCNPRKHYETLFVINDPSTLPIISPIMSEQDLILEMEVYTFYYAELVKAQDAGEKCLNGKPIEDLLEIVKNKLDNIDEILNEIHDKKEN